MDNPLTIVLTGATGYVGRALLRQCELRGNVKVRAIVQNEVRLVKAMNWDRLPDWVAAVPGRLPDVPWDLFPDENHVIVHFGVKQIDHDGTGFKRTNVLGTERLLSHSSEKTLGVIYGSTLSVLGQGTQRQVSETQEINPETALANSRAEAETICYQWAKENQRSAYGLRPRFILGAEDQFVLPGLAKLVEKKQRIGSGKQGFSVIHVDDYAKIILALADLVTKQQAPEQAPLNIGYHNPVTFNQLLGFIAQANGDAYKPGLGIPALPLIPKIMRLIPPLASKATQFELVGFDHSGVVTELEKRIGGEIVGRPVEDALRSATNEWAENQKTRD